MSYSDSLSYFLTVLALAIAPGPVVLMLIAKSASNDIKGAVGFGVGFSIGAVAIISAVCFGLSAWLETAPEMFAYTKYPMIAYILWVAWGIWTGETDLSQDAPKAKGSTRSPALAGMLTCFISPYMAIMLPLSLPEILNLSSIEMPAFLILALITFAGVALAAAIVIGFAARLRHFARSPNGQSYINKGVSSLLVCGGGSMVFL